MLDKVYEYTKIRENIWQIKEDDGVCCTLVKGSELAVLIDTGYGVRNLRAFVEENVTTPCMVIDSHGHPDHIGGNHWFDEIFALRGEWDVIRHFEEKEELRNLVQESLFGDETGTGIQVYIGNETPIQTMKDCSVVTATYELGDGVKGTIGIIGPKRMDYENVMDNLKTLRSQLDGMLNKLK